MNTSQGPITVQSGLNWNSKCQVSYLFSPKFQVFAKKLLTF